MTPASFDDFIMTWHDCVQVSPLQLTHWLTKWVTQRSATTASSAEGAGSWKNNALPASATVLAVGSVAWYWHLYGRNADAMTPAEEG
jgi:hypothetical protein